jgi:predicted GIY-YIG superfamily endonuclease
VPRKRRVQTSIPPTTGLAEAERTPATTTKVRKTPVYADAYIKSFAGGPWYLYIIDSAATGTRYVGITKNPAKRIKSHRRGGTISTAHASDWRFRLISPPFVDYIRASQVEYVLQHLAIPELPISTVLGIWPWLVCAGGRRKLGKMQTKVREFNDKYAK